MSTVLNLRNIFYVVCCNEQERIVKNKILRRAQVLALFQCHSACIVASKACATSHYWVREIMKGAYTVKLTPLQHVKAFLMGNKIPISGKSL